MLDRFSGVPLVRLACRPEALPAESAAYARDSITLGWEERLKVRSRRRTDGGCEFGTTLPRGTVLRDGDCLLLEQERLVVVVTALAEPVFVMEPAAPADWGLYAYHIGNNHQPVMFTSREIICPDLPGLEQLLTYHAIPYVRDRRAFTPLAHTPAHQDAR